MKTRLTPTYIPTTPEEMAQLGWQRPDILLVTGDTYIDSAYIGAVVIGRVLLDAGYRVGLIAQPDIHGAGDITRMGEPLLFWGVTAGSMDSMIANYTALGKPRRSDDLTPGGRNTRRPDRAVIVYANLIRHFFKQTVPIVLGGVEASLRRLSHFDAWSNKIRRSILFDAKADILAYGMAERTVLELADALKRKRPIHGIRGICYIGAVAPPPLEGAPGPDIELPPHAAVRKDEQLFSGMFHTFYSNTHWRTAVRLLQRQDTRYLIHNPPQPPASPQALDAVYELPYTRNVHPYYERHGHVPALDTIRFSITTHRGCYGECRFCAIAVHQGVEVVSRSLDSLVREAATFQRHPAFKGIVADVGGPTANMYGIECERKVKKGPCPGKSCLFPKRCPGLPIDHGPQTALLEALRAVNGIRKVFVGSGLRTDMVIEDRINGKRYMENLMRHHVSGQLKIAPEHCANPVLKLMGKPDNRHLEQFIRLFNHLNDKTRQKLYLTYYLMAAHPGCTQADMLALKAYAAAIFKGLPEQVQLFTPCPSTYAALMYHTQIDPFTNRPIYVEKSVAGKQQQKQVLGKTDQTAKRRFIPAKGFADQKNRNGSTEPPHNRPRKKRNHAHSQS